MWGCTHTWGMGDNVTRIGERPLTARQKAFVDAYCGPETRTLSECYAAAYSVQGWSPKQIRTEASRVKKHPGVSRAIEARRMAQERINRRDDGNRRRAIIDRLEQLAQSEDTPAAAAVSALKLLGTEVGLFNPTSKVEVNAPQHTSESETLADLEATLRDALG